MTSDVYVLLLAAVLPSATKARHSLTVAKCHAFCSVAAVLSFGLAKEVL